MNLLDSSGWLEYFADGPNAKKYIKPLNELEDLIVPTICLYEVFKVVLRERDLAIQFSHYRVHRKAARWVPSESLEFR